MNLDEFNHRTEQLFENIARSIPNVTQGIAGTALAVTRDRIQQRGLDAEEQALPDYSAAYRAKKQKRYGAEAVTHTNLTATGRMWNNMKVLGGEPTNNGYVARVGAPAQENDEKAFYNSERYGDILRVSEKEEQLLAEDLDSALQEIIDKSGF